MDLKEKILVGLALRGLKYAIKSLRAYLEDQDFKEVGDKILNLAEGKFKEDGLADTIVEEVCGEIRAELDIPDSNPDN